MNVVEISVTNEAEMVALGGRLSPLVGEHAIVTLQGGLGAGKTTLVRGLLQGAGFVGAVKSPTFSLVEDYQIKDARIFHFDLYRVQQPEELEYMGIRDYIGDTALCLIEWPEKAGTVLPTGDINIIIRQSGQNRTVQFEMCTDRGQTLFDRLGLAALNQQRAPEN
jgi:tRNA threonylcarbamoyladenosine biosynthesis protein TsaE